MPRTDNDSWDLATSVGATATMVAAARAVATRRVDAVIDDPFAEPLVRAVGVDFFTKLATGELKSTDLDPDGAGGFGNVDRLADSMAARTRFFDDFLHTAVDTGIRQAVILAAGLDARAYRLAWPAGTVVFEVDQPEVIRFKTETLAGLGAAPTADRRAVAIDLRDDWVSALTSAGFDPAKPTAWIAEGLLGYLPPEAQDRLLDRIAELSPAGSMVAAEEVLDLDNADDEEFRERMKAVSDRWQEHGLQLDFSDLIYTGERADVSVYLGGKGWKSDSVGSADLLTKYGLPPAGGADAGFADIRYITAAK